MQMNFFRDDQAEFSRASHFMILSY